MRTHNGLHTLCILLTCMVLVVGIRVPQKLMHNQPSSGEDGFFAFTSTLSTLEKPTPFQEVEAGGGEADPTPDEAEDVVLQKLTNAEDEEEEESENKYANDAIAEAEYVDNTELPTESAENNAEEVETLLLGAGEIDFLEHEALEETETTLKVDADAESVMEDSLVSAEESAVQMGAPVANDVDAEAESVMQDALDPAEKPGEEVAEYLTELDEKMQSMNGNKKRRGFFRYVMEFVMNLFDNSGGSVQQEAKDEGHAILLTYLRESVKNLFDNPGGSVQQDEQEPESLEDILSEIEDEEELEKAEMEDGAEEAKEWDMEADDETAADEVNNDEEMQENGMDTNAQAD